MTSTSGNFVESVCLRLELLQLLSVLFVCCWPSGKLSIAYTMIDIAMRWGTYFVIQSFVERAKRDKLPVLIFII